jgi:hypothetical protein
VYIMMTILLFFFVDFCVFNSNEFSSFYRKLNIIRVKKSYLCD